MKTMVLEDVINAVSNMPAPVMTNFQSGRWGQLLPELEFTRRIAIQLSQDPERKIWTAGDTHRFIPENAPELSFSSPFFLGHSKIDVSWAQGLDSEIPTDILEVKLRSSAAPSQDHWRYLSEVCAVAAEVLNSEGNFCGYCVFICDSGERRRTPWFSDMVPQEQIRIELEPTSAVENHLPDFPDRPRRPYWINQANGLIRPDFQSAFNKIFSGIETAHYVGTFQREGVIGISCTVTHQETENGYWIVQYAIDTVELIETDLPLNEWWP